MSHDNFIQALGVEFLEVRKDRILARMEARQEHTNGSGIVHGGVYMAFADSLGARGAIMNLPAGTRTSTIESKTNFIRGCPPGTLTGESLPMHVGRTTQVWTTTITDMAGKKLAVVTQTQIVLPATEGVALERQQAIRVAAGG